MHLALSTAFALAAANQVTVSPDLSDTKPEQHVVVKTSAPGMVRLEVDSQGVGTTCEVVDHLRGPFRSSGTLGRKDCKTDLFLDAGLYKVRLRSPAKANKRLKVKAKPFTERNQPLRRLAPGREDVQEVPEGSQASWWVHVEKRGHVSLAVTGRSVGKVALWRNGEWVEDVRFNSGTNQVRDGQPRHGWSFEQTLEAGDYLMTAYGTNAREWSQGKPDDRVWVMRDAPRAPGDRQLSFEIPERGWLRYELPREEGVFAAVGLDETPARRVSFSLQGLSSKQKDFDVGIKRAGGSGNCRVEKSATIPVCSMEHTGSLRHLLMINGPPGTRGEIVLARTSSGTLNDGDVSGSRDLVFKAKQDGAHLLGSFDLPPDPDAAPLTCDVWAVEARTSRRTAKLGSDPLTIDWFKPFVRRFNYDRDETVRFHVEKVGFYQVETSGTKNRCELYKLNGKSRERITESEKEAKCAVKKFLSPGDYEVRMHGGKRGIITLKIGQWGLTGKEATGGKASCWTRKVNLKRLRRYAIDHTRSSKKRRGLIARPLPLTLSEPLPIAVGEGRTFDVPVSGGGPLVVRALSGPKFRCALGGSKATSKRGVCRLPAGSGELKIESDSDEPLFVVISRPRPTKKLPPLRAWSPRFEPLPLLRAGQARFFDFDRSQTTSLLVDVKEAGLYDVTTTGLLATECRMRTATAPNLWRDNSGGRGRNCRVQTYLRPGQYLLSVATHGQSKGRAGVVLRGKPPTKLPALPAGEERFYEAAPGTLYQSELIVNADGRYNLRSRGQGVSLACRLDDHDGWPLERVPASCDASRNLKAGRYLWTEMPLTVESQRHVELSPVESSEAFSGGGPHAIELHKRYTVELDEETGKDRFTFTLKAPMTVGVELNNGMLGRLYKAGSKDVLEVIAPGGGGGFSEEEEYDEDIDPCEMDPSLCEEEEYYEEEEAYSGEYGGEPMLSTRAVAPPPAPAMPRVTTDGMSGQKVKLAAGSYVLETQHRRADVGIAYQVQLHVAELAPDVARSLPVPSESTLIVPSAGFVRVRTRGEVDVRCRVFDASGVLRVESESHGDDWNCAFTEPLPKGRYRFILEPEARSGGSTFVEVSAPAERDGGVLKNNTTMKTGTGVVRAAVPKARGDEIIEVDLSAREPISCAITTPEGRVLAQSVDKLSCRHLIAGADKAPFLTRVWTTQRPADVRVKIRRLPARSGRGGALASGRAVTTTIDRPGRYLTGPGVMCHVGASPGVLEDCSGEVSLPVGPAVFARFQQKGKGKLALTERRWTLDDAPSERARLRRAPTLMASTSSRAALHLYSVELPRGASAAPACAVTGGVSRQSATRCYAVTPPVRASVLSAWIASERDERAKLSGVAAAPAGEDGALALGARDLRWPGAVGTFTAPRAPASVELTLDAGGWAAAVDARGRATGMCPPAAKMSACSLRVEGGKVYVVSAGKRARARVFEAEERAPLARLETAHESFSPTSGQLRLDVPPADATRTVEVRGESIRGCALMMAGGRRVDGCRVRLPGGTAAVLEIDHGAGAVVALAYARGWREVSRWTTHVPRKRPKALDEGERASLEGTFLDRAVTLKKGGVLSVRAESGVCAILSGRRVLATDGMGRGCDLARALPKGDYRVMVRAFAGRPLAGGLAWARSDVEGMKEGVHPEAWVAAGESRFFRFDVARGSEIGLGVRTDGETLECALRDGRGALMGRGCQQFKKLESGAYLLEVRAPDGTAPRRFQPVVLGLEGGEREVPEEVLQELFRRIGVSQ
jgi:hypothetical protein